MSNTTTTTLHYLLAGPTSPPPQPQSFLLQLIRFILYPISKYGIQPIAGILFFSTACIEQLLYGDSFCYKLIKKMRLLRRNRYEIIIQDNLFGGVIQDKPSTTAQLAALSKRLCNDLGISDDYLAKYVVPEFAVQILSWSQQLRYQIEGEYALRELFVGYRTEFFDRLIRNSKQVEQVVILAAGYCTRAYRRNITPNNKGVRFFEIDIETTQTSKRKLIHKYEKEFQNSSSSHIEYVTVDFSCQKFMDELNQHGFNKNLPTIVTIEGLVYYLTWSQIEDMLIQIHSGMASGTLVGLDLFMDTWSKPEYASSVYADRGRRVAQTIVASFGEPFKWGLNPIRNETPKDVFEKLGYKVVIELDRIEIENILGKSRCSWIGGRKSANEIYRKLARFVVLQVM
jgi:methyltransferase (TIGR00027 family)